MYPSSRYKLSFYYSIIIYGVLSSFWGILFKSIMFTLVQSLNYMLTCLSLQGISNYEQLRLKNLQDNADFFEINSYFGITNEN
jgi:hypothetical protein